MKGQKKKNIKENIKKLYYVYGYNNVVLFAQ